MCVCVLLQINQTYKLHMHAYPTKNNFELELHVEAMQQFSTAKTIQRKMTY